MKKYLFVLFLLLFAENLCHDNIGLDTDPVKSMHRFRVLAMEIWTELDLLRAINNTLDQRKSYITLTLKVLAQIYLDLHELKYCMQIKSHDFDSGLFEKDRVALLDNLLELESSILEFFNEKRHFMSQSSEYKSILNLIYIIKKILEEPISV